MEDIQHKDVQLPGTSDAPAPSKLSRTSSSTPAKVDAKAADAKAADAKAADTKAAETKASDANVVVVDHDDHSSSTAASSSATASSSAAASSSSQPPPTKLAKPITGPEIVKKIKKALKKAGLKHKCVDGKGLAVIIARCWRIATKYGVSATSLATIVNAYLDLYGSHTLVDYLQAHPNTVAGMIMAVGKMAVLALAI